MKLVGLRNRPAGDGKPLGQPIHGDQRQGVAVKSANCDFRMRFCAHGGHLQYPERADAPENGVRLHT